MKVSLICFSMTGFLTALRLKEGLAEQGMEVSLFKKSKYLEDSVTVSTGEWAGNRFPVDDGIIFVGACGIAVRSIAPYVASKKSDPAVLVIDECGKFVISLLSGHLGGANQLTETAAAILGAQPVVTTATDLHSRFAVDVFAKKNNCQIYNMKAAKEVSAAILAGEPVGFYSEFPWKGELPQGLVICDDQGRTPEGTLISPGVSVTIHTDRNPFLSTVQVVPRTVTLGMGCRKDKDPEGVYEAAGNCISEAGIYRASIEKLTSISLKKNEPGLISLGEKWNIPFVTYEEEELKNIQGEFTPSSFVKTITGVDNVCERSAVLGSSMGRLIRKKYGQNGVTTALAVRNWEVHFE